MTRTLSFPDDEVGKLWTFDENGYPSREIADARGTITTDEPRIALAVPADVAQDLSFLRALPPRAIDGLKCARCEDVTQLRHATHLDLRALLLPYALLGGAALDYAPLHPRLEHLDITAAWGIDHHVHALAQLASLRTLGVFETSFSDAHVVHLSAMTSLERFDGGYTKLTDAGIASLPPLAALTDLSLNELPIGDASVPALAARTSLRVLGLVHTKISAAGFRTLSAALPDCEIRGA